MKVCLCCLNPEVFPYDGNGKQNLYGACRWAVVPDDTPVNCYSENPRSFGWGCISHEVMERAGLVKDIFWQKPNGRDFFGEVIIIEGRFNTDIWVDKMAENHEEVISYLRSTPKDTTTEKLVKHWVRVAEVTLKLFNRSFNLHVCDINMHADYGCLYKIPSGANPFNPFEFGFDEFDKINKKIKSDTGRSINESSKADMRYLFQLSISLEGMIEDVRMEKIIMNRSYEKADENAGEKSILLLTCMFSSTNNLPLKVNVLKNLTKLMIGILMPKLIKEGYRDANNEGILWNYDDVEVKMGKC